MNRVAMVDRVNVFNSVTNFEKINILNIYHDFVDKSYLMLMKFEFVYDRFETEKIEFQNFITTSQALTLFFFNSTFVVSLSVKSICHCV